MFFDFFSQFDYALARFAHSLAEATSGNLYLLMRGITILGDHGLILILASLVLMLFRRTRKTGAVCLFAVAFGALFTNVIIKNVMFRPRPFEDEASVYHQWWVYAGSLFEDKSSFPSGHATASMAFGLSVFLTNNKKFSWAALFIPLLIGFSRIYFCVHYASDVVFGYINGASGAIISYFMINWIYALMFRYPDNSFVRFWFDFSIVDLFGKKEKKQEKPD